MATCIRGFRRAAATWGLGLALTAAARGEQPADLPVLTAKNAAALTGKTAQLELQVVEIKFASRRQTHFLSGDVNFRAPGNLVVAVRQADFEKFRAGGVPDLAKAFHGRRVRARGRVTLDEGQTLLVVSAPGDLELVAAPASIAAPVTELAVLNAPQKPVRLPLPLPAEMPRTKLLVEHEGEKQAYEGVLLSTLLEHAQVVLGNAARGPLLARYVLVSAADGYRALLSLAEIDPHFSAQTVLLAERLDGQPLNEKEGPLRLIVSGDKRPRRWVKSVSSLEVGNPQPAEPVR